MIAGMIFKQFRRVRIAYHFSRFSDKLSLQKVRDAYPTRLIFTKTNSGGADKVWFYNMLADGWSLDDKRQPLLSEEKLGVTPAEALTEAEHGKNNLPDVLTRWELRETTELERPRTEQSFCVPKADIVANGYDLSINRYKEVVHEVIEHRHPKDIMAKLAELEDEIQTGMKKLEGMLF